MSYSRAEGLGSGSVHEIRVSADGTVWVGTDGGLSRIRAGRVATLSTVNGLPCNSVDSTIEDAGGGLWLYTPCGVVHLPAAEMRGWTDVIDRGGVAPQVRPIVLDSRDGAPRAVTSSLTMTPHMVIGADGKIWLAAQDGVTVVDSIHLPRNAIPPPVQIEQLVADRRAYTAKAGVRLPPLVRDLQIDYTALSFVAPEKNPSDPAGRPRSRMAGRRHRSAGVLYRSRAARLPLSRHCQQQQRRVERGWRRAGILDRAGVLPDPWFQALVVAAALGLMWAGYRGRVRQVARQYQRTPRRTRRRAHTDRTGTARYAAQSFQGLVLKFQTVPNLLPDRPAEARAARNRDRAGREGDHRRPQRPAGASNVHRRAERSRERNPQLRRRARARLDARRRRPLQRRRRRPDARSASNRP